VTTYEGTGETPFTSWLVIRYSISLFRLITPKTGLRTSIKMRCSAAFVASTLAVLLGRAQANPVSEASVEARIPNEVLNKRNIGGVYM
jgi:hypothetical protein